MMSYNKLILFATFLIIALPLRTSAKKNKQLEPKPAAILVQLPVFKHRIDWLEKANAHNKIATIINDRTQVIEREIMDFTDNFNFCPVYYFMDTNFYKILDRKFEGVFLDKDLKSIPIPDQANGDFFIVTFGYPIQRKKDIDNESRSKDPLEPSNVSTRTYQKLVVMNKEGLLVKRPDLNGSYNIYSDLKLDVEYYTYRSTEFDIYYRPYAGHLQKKLQRFYPNNKKAGS